MAGARTGVSAKGSRPEGSRDRPFPSLFTPYSPPFRQRFAVPQPATLDAPLGGSFQLAKDMRASNERGESRGLSDDDLAFYDPGIPNHFEEPGFGS